MTEIQPTVTSLSRRRSVSARVAACTLLMLLAPSAWAALGEPSASVAADGTPVTSGQRLAAVTGSVRQQSVLTPDGVRVDEFSANGVVFALRWSGGSIPDLAELFDSRFAAYAAAQRAHGSGLNRAPLVVDTSALVAHTWGHPGDFNGSAYVPALLPPGVDLASLGVEP